MPAAAAEIYDKGPGEKVLILNTRTAHVYPFEALNWLDLRVAFFLSLTDVTDDDDPTGLAETMGLAGTVPPQDRVWIGVKTRRTATIWGGTFIGFTNAPTGGRGDSLLVSSNIGLGDDSNFWRVKNSQIPSITFIFLDNGNPRREGLPGIEQHYPQDPVDAGGYAVMLGIQFTRPNINSRLITAKVQTDGAHSGDMLFSDTPTQDVLISNMQSWPSQVQTIGPIELSEVPDALYFYWPFRNSRLRIHSCAAIKAR